MRTFEYFKVRVVPFQDDTVHGRFWSELVLQCCHQEPAIYYTALALSAFCETPVACFPTQPMDEQILSNEQQRQALLWYGKGLQEHRKMQTVPGTQGVALAVVGCSILSSVEMMLHHRENALQLLQSAVRIWSDFSQTQSTESDAIQQMMAKQAVVLSLFNRLPQQWRDRHRPSGPSSLKSLDQISCAIHQLLSLCYDVIVKAIHQLIRGVPPGAGSADLAGEQQDLLQELDRWQEDFKVVRGRLGTCSRTLRATLAKLQLYHRVAWIWLSHCLEIEEHSFDKSAKQFEEMVVLAETALESFETQEHRVAFSYDMGITAPLHFGAVKCRIPSIRRKFVLLLQRAPAQESVWAAPGLLHMLEAIIAFEESKPFVQSDYWHEPVPSKDTRFHQVFILQQQATEAGRCVSRFFVRGVRLIVDARGRVCQKEDILPINRKLSNLSN